MGWIRDRVPQRCTVLVVQFFRPEGNGWGPVERSWGPLGAFFVRSPLWSLAKQRRKRMLIERAMHLACGCKDTVDIIHVVNGHFRTQVPGRNPFDHAPRPGGAKHATASTLSAPWAPPLDRVSRPGGRLGTPRPQP